MSNNSEIKEIELKDLEAYNVEDFREDSLLKELIKDKEESIDNKEDFENSQDSEKLIGKNLENEKNKLKKALTEELNLQTKIIYALPSFSKMSSYLILNIHAFLFYESRGASLLLMSFATAFTRCIELFFKPIIAFSSDNAEYKMGRRKPFIIFGSVFYCIFLVCIFSPPESIIDVKSVSTWFTLFYILFFIADTVCIIPYFALGPELSIVSKQRESLYLYVYAFQYVGVILSSIGPSLITRAILKSSCNYCKTYTDDESYKTCNINCNEQYNVISNEKGLLYMCMFIGFLFVLSSLILSILIKEKKSNRQREKSYIIPTLYKIISNKPFIQFILPYICDISIVQIFTTMLPFYINYIIDPYNTCVETNTVVTSSKCKTNFILGLSMGALFLCSLIMIVAWHFAVKKIGKKRAWSSYSLISIVTYCLFLFCGKGDISLIIIFTALQAIPSAGAYLNDVFLTDVIDYDELLTGKRNEGIYTVFTVFIPKVVGIIAQSIPLLIMYLMGFVPSSNGIAVAQSSKIIIFIKMYSIGLPVLLTSISFLLKIRYPINDEKMKLLTKNIVFQNMKLQEIKGSANFYIINNPIYPDSNIVRTIIKNESEGQTQFVCDHFQKEKYLSDIYNKNFAKIKKEKMIYLFVWLGIIIVFTTLLGFTFKLLNSTSLSFLPLVSIILVTVGVCFLTLCVIQINVIQKCIDGTYQIDVQYAKLLLYKYQQENNHSRKERGLLDEIKLLFKCKKLN